MREKNFIFRITLLITLMLHGGLLYASKFSPPGLYDVEHLTLKNGMDVILKPRHGAHTFSVRVWIGVGTQDFPCEQQETPHFLEHLLFTGTSQHTEAELEHMVADHGGSWNAATGLEETTYSMDIYSRHADFAINILYEIITDSSITEENVEISRDIIHREAGGKPSKIKQWFRLQGVGVNATEKAVLQLVPDSNFICEAYVTAEGISRDDIIDTFNQYYVPENMALIVVGDFDKKAIVKQIQKTFGTITEKSVTDKFESVPGESISYEPVTGTLSPLLSDEVNVGLMYRLPGYWSDDSYPMIVIEEYLYYKINEAVRFDRGLAYAPSTWSYSTDRFGLFGAAADVNPEDIDEALSLLKDEMRSLEQHLMDEALLEKSKLKLLLRSVQGYEANSDIANYYASQYVIFKKYGYFENVEEKIEAVTIEDINRVVKKYLSEDLSVTIIDSPTLTYTQFYLMLSLIAFTVIGLIARLYYHAHTHFRNNRR